MENTNMHDDEYLEEIFNEIGINLTMIQINKFNKYFDMLIETNKVMNLTAITEYKEVIVKHFADSVLVSKVIDFSNIKKVIDIGTGAGFPGIPLKIMFPEIEITLLDSLNKRINFLKEVVDELELENVECIHGRAEDFGHKEEYREKYDLCVSRAVANLSTLSEYCTPFVKIGGKFISYKSSEIEEEVNGSKKALKILSCGIEKVEEIELPGENDVLRKFVIINKLGNTGKKYPRKSGVPSKIPLN